MRDVTFLSGAQLELPAQFRARAGQHACCSVAFIVRRDAWCSTLFGVQRWRQPARNPNVARQHARHFMALTIAGVVTWASIPTLGSAGGACVDACLPAMQQAHDWSAECAYLLWAE